MSTPGRFGSVPSMEPRAGHFDEMVDDGSRTRSPYAEYRRWLDTEDPGRLLKKSAEAEALFRRTGITFNVYGEDEADERLIPFDIVPRIISAREWARPRRGASSSASGRSTPSSTTSTTVRRSCAPAASRPS